MAKTKDEKRDAAQKPNGAPLDRRLDSLIPGRVAITIEEALVCLEDERERQLEAGSIDGYAWESTLGEVRLVREFLAWTSIVDLRPHVSRVLEQWWNEELRDYRSWLRDREPQVGHIFETLVVLRNFVDGWHRTAKWYADFDGKS